MFYASEGGCIFVCTDDFVFTYVSVCMREKEDNKSVFYVSGGGHIICMHECFCSFVCVCGKKTEFDASYLPGLLSNTI